MAVINIVWFCQRERNWACMQVHLNQLKDRYQKLTTPADASFRQCQNIMKDTWTNWVRLNFDSIGPTTSSCITKETHDAPGELNYTHLFHTKCSTSRPHLWSFGEVDSTNASVDGPALIPYSGRVHIDDSQVVIGATNAHEDAVLL